ncbi:MAG TPA: hypothetical protein VED18_12495 [Candidatus Sulfotelmatobacter sp.]|nr:hypothetical protein [Candidatus Sulfotelmatobacter sp.]
MNGVRSGVWIVDNDPSLRTALGRLVAAAGHRVETFASARESPGRPGYTTKV